MTDSTLEDLCPSGSEGDKDRERCLRETYFRSVHRLCAERPSMDAFLGEVLGQIALATEIVDTGVWMIDREESVARCKLRCPTPARAGSGRIESPLPIASNGPALARDPIFRWHLEGAPGDAAIPFAAPFRVEDEVVGFLMLELPGTSEWTTAERGWITGLASLIGAGHETERRTRPVREQRMARHRARLGLLAGGVAHDLNNLLVGVNGGLELAFQSAEPGSMLHDDLELIRRSARKAVALSDSLLAFAGGRQTPLEAVEFNEVVVEAAEEAAGQSPGCTLRTELDVTLETLQADPRQVRQIIANLISNAAHAVGENGRPVILRTGSVDGSHAPEDEDWVLRPDPGEYQFVEVQDTGHGIPRHLRERVFEAFFTTRAGASGIGLAAVLGLLERRGGAIHLRSDPEQGTTVRILLPVSRAAAPAPDPSPVAATGPILLVDDDTSVLDTVSRMLTSHGHEVLTASSGLDAVEIFRTSGDQIAAVLIDVEMPGIDGIETLERLQGIQPDVQAILISGYSPRVDLDSITSAPFLRKPFTGEQVLALLPAPGAAETA